MTALRCSDCGATVEAACRCGVPYVPARARAAAAVAANPEKSDRAIAADIGVGNATVSRARKKSTVSDDTVEKRVGLDGKARRMPTKEAEPDDLDNDVAPPEVVEENILYVIARMDENARASRRVLKVSTIGREAAERISTAIDRTIKKLRLMQSTLATKGAGRGR